MDEGSKFCLTKYLCSYFGVIFTCYKILRHGTDGFTSPPKEVLLCIFMALTNPMSRLDLNPRTLGPMEIHELVVGLSWQRNNLQAFTTGTWT
jgi:hypothetical protein